MRSKKKLAAFDIDGTVFRSSLLLELVEELVKEGIFPARTRAAYEREYVRWLDRKGEYGNYVEKAVMVFARQIQGIPYKVGEKAAKTVLLEKKDRVYRYTRDLISTLKKRGYFLIAVSHSPKFIVGPFAKSLGFDKAYGSIYAADKKGKFTGSVDFEEIIRDKAAILAHALKKFDADAKRSIAVGDTENDIPMLKLVGQPVAFNPNQKLYRYAKKHGWKVVVERKDVVYAL
ncbi:MAG: HAD family phosphatase [Patescibacteria group bacterium]|nr:HAD family phosphatase [Patescibacteria group bacterium]